MKKLIPFIVFLLTHNVYAQSVLRLKHINVEDGLSQSSVYNIFQDSYGFMWFATGDGLDRYDGRDFIVYKSHLKDTSSSRLKDRNINSCLFEDKHNRLWMSTDEGVSVFDPRHGVFKVALQKYSMLLAIDDRSLWASAIQSGLYEIDVNNERSVFYPFTDKMQKDAANVNAIYNGAETRSGIWMADNAGLLFFDRQKREDKRMLKNDKCYSVYLLNDGHLIIGSEGGVFLYDTNNNTAKFIPIEKTIQGKRQQWKSIAEDAKKHTVYIGAMNSGTICKLDLDTRKYEFLDFQSSSVYCLFIDRSENLWVGTDGNGIYKLDIKQPKFFCYTPKLPIGSDNSDGLMVKSIFRDDSGIIWMGSYNDGLISYDPVLHRQENVVLSFPTRNILIGTIIEDSAGAIVFTAGPKITWLDRNTGKELMQIRLPVIPRLSAKAPDIYSLAEWKKDHYVVATNIGLFTLNCAPNQPAQPPYYAKGSASWTYNLQKARNNEIYVGRREGYTKIRMIGDTVLQTLDAGFENIAVRHFYKSDRTAILWMATEEGLVAYDEATKQIQVFDETSGLANSCVYAILSDNDSTLWISTNKGLSQVSVQYGDNKNIKVQFTNYTSKDGLQSSEFNTGAFYRGNDGILFFGGIAGINWFDPKAIRPNPYPATPAIASIFADDKLFAGDTATYIQNINLPFDRSTISFTLRALEYTNAEQNQFAYKLEGLDKDWVYTANDKVRYSTLLPGYYTFLLKVSNNDRVWNEQPLKLTITIWPPYWQTRWFRIMIILFCVAVCYLAARIYVKRKVRVKTRELEKEHALYMERLRISKDVHDDLGSGLSKISLMAEIVQKKASGDSLIGNDIRHISSVSKELVENMRDLVWVLNPQHTTLDQLVARLREYCADYLDNMPVAVGLDFPDNVPPVPVSRELQRNVFLTVKEAINNCIKHAHADTIKITLKFETDNMEITVSDNGKGFDMAHMKGNGNGLRNMRQRIETIGGAFNITVAGGTTIRISVPFKNLAVDNTTFV